MPTITLREARRRTRLDLKSDLDTLHYTYSGLESDREGQRRMERNYPAHGIVRRAAIAHFLKRSLDVYPQGLTVDGARTGLDFAIFRDGRIIFVECLTAHAIHHTIVSKKRRIVKYAPLIFVIEARPRVQFETPTEWLRFRKRVARIAQRHETYLCSSTTRKLRRVRTVA